MLPNLPPLTRFLILCNVAIFIAELSIGDALIGYFGLWPLQTPAMSGYPPFMPWQLVTYGFLHGSLGHLLFNMFALYMFGGELENLLGRQRFFYLYFVSVISAAAMQLLVAVAADGPPQATIGASGGVFGLLLAFGLFFPRRTIVPLIPPIPMPAWLFVTLYGLLELMLGIFGSGGSIAHFAHLGGMLGAWLLIDRWMKRRR